MTFESGRKLGLTASLINVVMPIVALFGTAVFVISFIFSAVSRINNGAQATTIFGVFGFLVFLIATVAISLAGYIMFMLAMHKLSSYYNEPGIFKNVLYAFLLSVVAYVFIFALEFVFIFSSIPQFSRTNTPPTVFPAFSLFFIAVIFGAVAFGILNGWLYMRAFNKLKEKSGVDNFGTAGILILVGTVVPIVAWIAWIFAYLGFRKLQPSSSAVPTVSYPSQPPPSTMAMKRCSNCGTDNYGDASYCRACGKPLQ